MRCAVPALPGPLKRALGNLGENALHYAGNVAIRLSSAPGRVCIAVEDDGAGIPEDQLRRVLEPFVRLDSARPRDTVGFGLGLPIVARIVENCFYHLEAPIRRSTGYDVHFPYFARERAYLPNAERIKHAATETLAF